MRHFHYHRPPRTVPGTAEDILAYLAAHGIRDKDSVEPVPENSIAPRIEKRKKGVFRMTLDLHGLTSEEASRRIRLTIGECGHRGVKELLVIHGRGRHSSLNEGPILKNLVRGMLDNELRLSVRDFRSGLPREGGEGVTLVYLP
jgi:DNA-nicking Smr family endonuclease